MRVQRTENGRDIHRAACDAEYESLKVSSHHARAMNFPWDHVQPSDRTKRASALVCFSCGLTEKQEQARQKV